MGPPAVDADAVYISAGANRHSAVADWSRDGTVAYGTDANIALWRPTDERPRGVTRLLRGHTDTVKAVKFLAAAREPSSSSSPSPYLVSGSDDQCLILWELRPDGTALLRQTVHEHAAPVHCIAVLNGSTVAEAACTRALLASGAADGTIKIWDLVAGALRLLQTIQTKPKFFPLALALSPLDGDGGSYILAAAGTKAFVQVFTAATATAADAADAVEFKLQATLSGHEGWIRSLDFSWEDATKASRSDLLLASASQDKYIRLWRVHRGADGEVGATAEAGSGAASSPLAFPGKLPSNKAHKFTAGGADYSVSFEALLLGHDDWIYSAKWHSPQATAGDSSDGGGGSSSSSRPRLLSTSADNSLAIWEADLDSGIWITSARLGELSKEKGATTATGSIGGFWTGLWSPSGRTVVCLGRTGSWRRWDLELGDADDGHLGGMWRQELSVSGHTKAVTGIAWSHDGGYLLSTSSDQTTRLHAEWRTRGGEKSEEPSAPTWHEISRPQIHGYDLNCIDSLGPSQFVSGADEKLMRVFNAPKTVARLLGRLTGSNSVASGPGDGGLDALPDAANIPVLGLSNKAVEAVDDKAADEAEAAAATAADAAAEDGSRRQDPDAAAAAVAPLFRASTLDLARPPYEDSLSRHTLWPEIEKLYGHGYELSCLAASHDGRVVASACRASSLNHAVIRLFATSPRWTEVRPPLAVHTLTATRLRFSPDDAYLLSVGRDRQWAVFQRSGGRPAATEAEAKEGDGGAKPDPDAELRYGLFQANPKGHTRMILDAAWAPLVAVGGQQAPLRAFATGGRDKNVKVWALKTNKPEPGSDVVEGAASGPAAAAAPVFELAMTIALEHPATAVDFLWGPCDAPDGSDGGGKRGVALAVGTEGGKISTYILDPETWTITTQRDLDSHLCSSKPILQLAWRPEGAREEAPREQQLAELAVACEDSSLRIYQFRGL